MAEYFIRRGKNQITIDFSFSPVCLFDSGIGGLNVLSGLKKILPSENYLYVADQKFCPYGNKGDEYVRSRVKKIVGFLSSFNPKIILIACNTASRFLPKDFISSDVVMGVIKATSEYVAVETPSKKVLLLATKSTIDGGLYQRFFDSLKISCDVVDCGNLVDDIENMKIHENSFAEKVKGDLINVISENFDSVIFGCTHFDFARQSVLSVLQQPVKPIFCKDAVAPFVVKFLTERKLLGNSFIAGKTVLLTTGRLDFFRKQLGFYNVDYDNAEKVVID